MGTAGGLHKFRDQILTGSPSVLLVLHCDICCPFPLVLQNILDFHQQKAKEKGAVGTLMSSKVDKEYASYYGCIVEDENHMLTHYAEKPDTFVSDLINSGIYCFSPEIFKYLEEVVTRIEKEDQG